MKAQLEEFSFTWAAEVMNTADLPSLPLVGRSTNFSGGCGGGGGGGGGNGGSPVLAMGLLLPKLG